MTGVWPVSVGLPVAAGLDSDLVIYIVILLASVIGGVLQKRKSGEKEAERRAGGRPRPTAAPPRVEPPPATTPTPIEGPTPTARADEGCGAAAPQGGRTARVHAHGSAASRAPRRSPAAPPRGGTAQRCGRSAKARSRRSAARAGNRTGGPGAAHDAAGGDAGDGPVTTTAAGVVRSAGGAAAHTVAQPRRRTGGHCPFRDPGPAVGPA